MQIGEVARETRLTVDAIRFYERQGLLPRAPRTEGGYRVYTDEAVESLRFLRVMQSLGFSLGEIRELLSLRDNGAHTCQHVRDRLASKLAAVRTKQSELRKLEGDLRRALNRCRRVLGKKRPGAHICPVLAEGKRTARRAP